MPTGNCGVCERTKAKYKCPTCHLPFCSVSCNKSHKATRCEAARTKQLGPYEPKRVKTEGGEDEEEAMLTTQQLDSLERHAEVTRKFGDERVKEILRRIDCAQDRRKALTREMRDPAFVEFCDDVLEAIGMKEVDKPFSLEEMIRQHNEECE